MMGLFVFMLSVEISSQVLELEILFGSNWDAFFFFLTFLHLVSILLKFRWLSGQVSQYSLL